MIKNISGKWTLNGLNMSELSPNEQKYLEDFIIQSKQELKPEKEQRKAPDWAKLLKEK